MIKRFSTLYVGHIELEDCGLAGRAADERRYPNTRLAEVFDTAVELARAVDGLGYETLWLAEHHFQHEGYECIPNIPMLAVDLAHRTERVRRAQSPTAVTLENGVRNRAWLCGPAEDIVAYLKEIERRYPGLEQVMIAWALGTPRALMIEQLTRFAREVMPAFRR